MLKKLFSSKFSIALIIVIISILLFIAGFKYLNNDKPGIITENTDDWNTYVNEKYGFSINYPKNWKVAEDFTEMAVKINIYKPEYKTKPPFDHFSDISNISIFPLGLGTEGVIGKNMPSTLKFQYETETAIDYLTKENQVWATLMVMKDVPKEWKDWGFIWIKNKINNPKFSCTRDGLEINIEECNPYDGDEFERSGTVDLEVQKIQKMILESFKIIE